ncbi:MAG: DUF4395 domain-containing protein [Mucilaginibacter sp.]
MKSELECPVDFVVINEYKARMIAFFVFVLTIIFLVTSVWLIPAFLIVDFALRASILGKYSLLGILSDAVIRQFKIGNKPTDRAPKRFSAGVGMLFSAAMLVSTLFHLGILSLVLACTLIIFAILESFFSFCAGCYVYTFLKKLNK